MANYLIPVYISDILKANASVYAIEDDVRCWSGCCRNLYSTHNEICKTEVSIVMTMFIYVISITAMSIEPSVIFLYGLAIFHAVGNAGTRVAKMY